MAVTKAWEQRKGESSSSYALFLIYRDMGPKRSFDRFFDEDFEPETELRENCGKIPSRSALEKLSSRWLWVERCRAWDNHLQAIRDREAAKEVAKWERRRQQALDQVYRDAQALRERFRQMMQFPLAKKEVKEGGKVTVITPVRWSAKDMAILARLAAEMESVAIKAAAKDPAEMSDAELDGASDPEDY